MIAPDRVSYEASFIFDYVFVEAIRWMEMERIFADPFFMLVLKKREFYEKSNAEAFEAYVAKQEGWGRFLNAPAFSQSPLVAENSLAKAVARGVFDETLPGWRGSAQSQSKHHPAGREPDSALAADTARLKALLIDENLESIYSEIRSEAGKHSGLNEGFVNQIKRKLLMLKDSAREKLIHKLVWGEADDIAVRFVITFALGQPEIYGDKAAEVIEHLSNINNNPDEPEVLRSATMLALGYTGQKAAYEILEQSWGRGSEARQSNCLRGFQLG